jgi:hypothetical protein
MGAAPVAEILCPSISREGVAKTHFSKLMARPLAAKAVKKASRWWRCVSLSGEQTCELSMSENTPKTVSGEIHHSLKHLHGVGQPKRREQIFKQAKWCNDSSFWEVLSRNRDLVITLDKINF